MHHDGNIVNNTRECNQYNLLSTFNNVSKDTDNK